MDTSLFLIEQWCKWYLWWCCWLAARWLTDIYKTIWLSRNKDNKLINYLLWMSEDRWMGICNDDDDDGEFQWEYICIYMYYCIIWGCVIVLCMFRYHRAHHWIVRFLHIRSSISFTLSQNSIHCNNDTKSLNEKRNNINGIQSLLKAL